MYDKLSGMTVFRGTEAAGFAKIYNLGVVVVPTNKPMIRTDFPDVIYRTRREKVKRCWMKLSNAAKPVSPCWWVR
ncbi:MAG: hypothetical protein R2860_04910 [Desulfobacterales bacterium]